MPTFEIDRSQDIPLDTSMIYVLGGELIVYE